MLPRFPSFWSLGDLYPLRPLVLEALGLSPALKLRPQRPLSSGLRKQLSTEEGVTALLDEAAAEGVAALMADALLTCSAPGVQVAQLANTRRRARGLGLQQRNFAQQSVRLLEAAGIPCVMIKGLSVAALYPEPALRPSVDLDLLIPAALRDQALALFEGQGGRVRRVAARDTHECDVFMPGGAIDLHWALFRPGRARAPLAPGILARRRKDPSPPGLPVPCPADLLLIMLLHTALTEHVSGRLLKALDLQRACLTQKGAWPQTLERLERSGLKTAAWAMLRFTQAHFALALPEQALRRLQPGPLRRRYLDRWLAADPAARYRGRGLLVRGAFSLALQDEPRDVLRAINTLRHLRPS